MSPNVPADSDGTGVCVEGLRLTRWGWSERGRWMGGWELLAVGRPRPHVSQYRGRYPCQADCTFSHPWSGLVFTVWLCLRAKAACNITSI